MLQYSSTSDCASVTLSGLVHEGLEIQTPSELSFTPLPEILPQEDAVLETEKEVEMPEEDEETLEAEAAVNRPTEEEEEEEEEEFEDEEVCFLLSTLPSNQWL